MNRYITVNKNIMQPQNQSSTQPSTDQLIAQERSRVSSFKQAFAPKQEHRYLFELFHHYRYPMIFGVLSLVMIITGGAFAFAKLGIMNPNKTNSEAAITATDQTNDSTGTNTWSSEDAQTTTESDTTPSGQAASNSTNSSTTNDTNPDGESSSDGGAGATEESDGDGDTSQENLSDEGDGGAIAPVDTSPVTAAAPAVQATTPTPSAPTPTLAHKFTTISWNSNAENTKVVADQVSSFATNSQIIGLQSLHNLAQRNSVKSKLLCSSCKYSGYLPPYTDSSPSQASYPIVWNKTSFTQVGAGAYRKMCDGLTVGTTAYAARYATWVRLQSKVNGKQIIVINTHLISGVESGGKATTNTAQLGRFKTHMANLVTLIKELKAANIPIYITGSFSVNYRYDRNAYTSYFPYASLKPLGMRSEWDLMNLSGIASTTGTYSTGSRIIDYVFTWERGDVTSNAIAIASSGYGSDYKPVFYTTTVK